jgi:hypothetical protein
MKSTNSANVGNSCIAAAGVPARAISCSIRRMAPVAASNVLMGKITILYPSSGCVHGDQSCATSGLAASGLARRPNIRPA